MMQEFVQSIKDTVEEALYDAHTALPAKIVSVDATTGLATVLPTMKRLMPDGSKLDYPQISGVPIVLPQGANQLASIAVPVKTDDSCLLIIAEQSLEYWLYGMDTDTTLPFDISNAICIPGLFQKPPDSFADACNNNAVIIDVGTSRLIVKESGLSTQGNLTVNGNLKVNGYINTDYFALEGSTCTLTGNINVTGNQTVHGSQSVGNGQTITGSQTMSANQTVNGSQTVSGNTTISGNLTASGTVNLG